MDTSMIVPLKAVRTSLHGSKEAKRRQRHGSEYDKTTSDFNFAPLGTQQSSREAIQQMDIWIHVMDRESILQLVAESIRLLYRINTELVDEKLAAAKFKVNFKLNKWCTK